MGRGRNAIVVASVSQCPAWQAFLVSALCVLALAGCDEDAKEMARLRALNNHSKHVGLNMDCAACHIGARDSAYAGLPSVDTCAKCHRSDREFPPTPPELMEYIDSGTEIPWVRVNRLPGHVYFSHETHVKYGHFDCGECHGDMKDPVNPVERPLVQTPKMAVCIECHRQQHASTDCLACHK